MPALLDGVMTFPQGYGPWYVYTVSLVASPASFQIYDLLFPDASGNFDRDVTDDDVLVNGYAFALAKFATGMTTVPVVVVGSLVPMIADNTLRPCCMVKLNYASSTQTATIASAADFAAGKVIGRFRNHFNYSNTLRVTAANDIIMVLTGCA